ncbi:MAG: ferritin family protein [Candidatus Omnitrophica bacterium]|jgi:rubrerythrin|nr:ferritin family protein [Candidatus Omnitrophota bacterium]
MNIFKTEGKISSVDFHPWIAFEVACKIEQYGEKFYSQLLEKITDIEIKKIIEELKNAEIKHYKMFKNMQKDIPKPENIEQDNIYQMMNFGVFEGKYDWTKFREIKDIIKFAIYIETKTIELYSFYQGMTKNETTKISLEKITNEEKTHKSFLENILKTKFSEEKR